MSGLEIVGAISGISNLAAIVFQLSKTLYEVGGSLANASSDIQDLARDLETFSEELHLLASLFDGGSNRYSTRIYDLVTKIIGDCAVICNKINKILDNVQNVGLRAKLHWVFKEKEILKLLGRLRDLKLSLMGMLGMLGALKADHLMDAICVVSPSLLGNVDLESIRIQNEEDEAPDDDKDKTSTLQDTVLQNPTLNGTSSICSSSGIDSSRQNQLWDGLEISGTNLVCIPIRSVTNHTSDHMNPDWLIPSSTSLSSDRDGLFQTPQAMESKDSFYSTHTSFGAPCSFNPQLDQEARLAMKAKKPTISQHEAYTSWRNDLIHATMKHYKVDHDSATDLVSSMPTPSLELQGGNDRPARRLTMRLRQSPIVKPQLRLGCVKSSQMHSRIELLPYQPKLLWWRAFNTLQITSIEETNEISECWERNRRQCYYNAPPNLRRHTFLDQEICLNARLQFMSQPNTNIPVDPLHASVQEPYHRIHNVYEMVQKTLNFKFGSPVWCFLPEIVTSMKMYSLPEYQEILVPQLAEVVTLVARYNVLESVYQNWPNMTLATDYEAALLELCKSVLVYLNHVKIFSMGYGRRSGGFDPLWLNDWVEAIRESDEKCRSFVVKMGDKIDTSNRGQKRTAGDVGEEDEERIQDSKRVKVDSDSDISSR